MQQQCECHKKWSLKKKRLNHWDKDRKKVEKCECQKKWSLFMGIIEDNAWGSGFGTASTYCAAPIYGNPDHE